MWFLADLNWITKYFLNFSLCLHQCWNIKACFTQLGRLFFSYDENQAIRLFPVAGVSSLTIEFFPNFFFFHGIPLEKTWQSCPLLVLYTAILSLFRGPIFKKCSKGDESFYSSPKSRWFHGSTNMDILPITILYFETRTILGWSKF